MTLFEVLSTGVKRPCYIATYILVKDPWFYSLIHLYLGGGVPWQVFNRFSSFRKKNAYISVIKKQENYGKDLLKIRLKRVLQNLGEQEKREIYLNQTKNLSSSIPVN